jgi:hypothetical protein
MVVGVSSYVYFMCSENVNNLKSRITGGQNEDIGGLRWVKSSQRRD